jgi:hypothetical protein
MQRENSSNHEQLGGSVKLTLLGVESQGGACPTLYATDKDTYVVQGWRTSLGARVIEIPRELLRFVEDDTELGCDLKATDRSTFTLMGKLVEDAETLAQMDIPSHETCVEVPKVRKGSANGSSQG